MLKNVPPLVTPDLLYTLALMGHGDEIAVVDRNYPASSGVARRHDLASASVLDAIEAISVLLPLDTFVSQPVARMVPVDEPTSLPMVQSEAIAALERSHGREVGVQELSRFEFYERARGAFAVVATSEDRPYGCLILTKGVL